MMKYDEVYEKWREARAFLVDDLVCGDFSVPSAEDLADAIAAEDEGRMADWDPCVSFYVYGESGLKREYFLTREMIESGEKYKNGMRVVYYGDHALVIVPLVELVTTDKVAA